MAQHLAKRVTSTTCNRELDAQSSFIARMGTGKHRFSVREYAAKLIPAVYTMANMGDVLVGASVESDSWGAAL